MKPMARDPLLVEKRRCEIIQASDQQFYLKLGNFKLADKDEDCTDFGPFASFAAVEDYLMANHTNPGSWRWNFSGLIDPPISPEAPGCKQTA